MDDVMVVEEQPSVGDGQYAAIVVVGTFTALLSLIGSSSIMWMTRDKLKPKRTESNVYSRLMFALSFGDLIFTIAVILLPFLAPVGTEWRWASGNTATCTASGFLTLLGLLLVSFYHCFLSVHFVLRVRYQWRPEEIMRILELPSHIVAWVVSLAISVAGIVTESYNPFVYFCTPTSYPQGCTSDALIDCERGGNARFGGIWDDAKIISMTLSGVQGILALTGIFATVLVYCSVRQQVRRNRRHSFAPTTTPAVVEASEGEDVSTTDGTHKSTQHSGRRPSLIASETITASLARIRSLVLPSERQGEKSRWSQEVGVQAILYSIAYLNNLVWPLILNVVYLSISSEEMKARVEDPDLFAIELLTAIFFPLQGFWNLFIYLRPRWKSFREVDPSWSRWTVLKKTMSSQPRPRATRRKSSDWNSSTQATGTFTVNNRASLRQASGEDVDKDSWAAAARQVTQEVSREHGELGLKSYFSQSSDCESSDDGNISRKNSNLFQEDSGFAEEIAMMEELDRNGDEHNIESGDSAAVPTEEIADEVVVSEVAVGESDFAEEIANLDRNDDEHDIEDGGVAVPTEEATHDVVLSC